MCLGVPGRVVEILGDDPLLAWGWVEFAGMRQRVALAFVPQAKLGNFVLVHAGVALSIVDEEEAKSVLAMLEVMEDLERPNAIPG